MGASRSHNMDYVSPNFFTPIPKFIVSYLARFLNRFQHVLGLEPTRKILTHNSRGSDGMQSPIGTQRKGILMLVVDSCIVKDQKCTIIAEFGKKKPAQTDNVGLLVRDSRVTSSPFNYLYDYCKQFAIMIAF